MELTYSEKEIREAIKTARSNGSVGKNPVVPALIRSTASKKDIILDYGCGPHAKQVVSLRKDGFEVVGYDFAEIDADVPVTTEPETLEWDIIYASNVLNVQSSKSMLIKTLDHLYALVKDSHAVLIANYPKEPRKLDLTDHELYELLHVRFVCYKDMKKVWSPVFFCLRAREGIRYLCVGGR